MFPDQQYHYYACYLLHKSLHEQTIKQTHRHAHTNFWFLWTQMFLLIIDPWFIKQIACGGIIITGQIVNIIIIVDRG